MCYGVPWRRRVSFRQSLCAKIEELPHLSKLIVSRLQQFPNGLLREGRELAVKHFIQQSRRLLEVRMGPSIGLAHDFIDNPKFLRSVAVIFRAAAAASAFAASRHMIAAQPSGEITE